ncbi:MAG: hypothetical protein AVO35_05070 [Candidatus Aegiribacteria sp. MLS_C]|nr:MAG: hypothetical protein AVO35_05070 [Candidatus Aegiribacteria sp. MLS_C]
MSALSMTGVRAGYNDLNVLRGIDISVMPGEICGLIGPNGAGKSTLLRSVIGLGVRMEGAITLCGEDIASIPRSRMARLVSYLPQNFNPSSRLSVFETVLLGRHPYRRGWSMDSREDLETARLCMEETDTWHLRERSFSNLSGGEKRLVMLASALAQEPRLLLLDEPGSSLDFRHQLSMWKLLRKLSGNGIAVVVSTHEVALAGRYMDSVLLLSGGRSAAFGSPKEVFTAGILSEVFQVDLTVLHDGMTDSWVVVPGP